MADPHRGLGYWATIALSVLIGVCGLLLAAGGVWLITLGGSWYYALAGAGLLISAYFLFRRSIAGVWLYLATFAGTLVWALWEAGLDGWAQVPRLLAPTVLLLLVLATIPVLRGRLGVSRGTIVAAAVGIVVASGTVSALIPAGGRALHAQETPAPADTAPVPTPPLEVPTEATAPAEPAPPAYVRLEVGADWPAYGGTHAATRYSPLTQITPDNVGALERIWEFRTGDLPENDEPFGNQNTPVKVGTALPLLRPEQDQRARRGDRRRVLDLRPSDPGRRHRLQRLLPRPRLFRGSHRRSHGRSARPGSSMLTHDARMIALDTETGQLCPDFGNGGIVNLSRVSATLHRAFTPRPRRRHWCATCWWWAARSATARRARRPRASSAATTP
jgi:quinoprotein glucose dehydrogenase